MNKMLTVAWREFQHTAMTKAFVFGAIIMPIVMMLGFLLVAPFLFKPNTTPLRGTVAIIAPDDVPAEFIHNLKKGNDEAKEIRKKIPSNLQNDAITNAVLPSNSTTELQVDIAEFSQLNDLKRQVREGELVGLIFVPDSAIERKKAEPEASTTSDAETVKIEEQELEVFIPSSFSPNHTKLLISAIEGAIVDVRLRRLGHDPENIHDLMQAPEAKATRLSAGGAEAPDNEFARKIIPMAFMFLLWIATFTSGQYLLTTTIEEKANKVMEVLLSAISPMQLLGGKILGQAGVSAVILLMYGSTAIAGLIAAKSFDLISVSDLVLLSLYFVMAYFMVATMMAAAGSAVSELRDAQSLMGPIMIIMFIPMMLWPVLSEHPNGLIATITSFTPPLIPYVMILRVTASTEPVAMWQILLSIVVGFVSVFVMIWMCARIFRIGILMQGKPPSFLQLLRWIKQG